MTNIKMFSNEGSSRNEWFFEILPKEPGVVASKEDEGYFGDSPLLSFHLAMVLLYTAQERKYEYFSLLVFSLVDPSKKVVLWMSGVLEKNCDEFSRVLIGRENSEHNFVSDFFFLYVKVHLGCGKVGYNSWKRSLIRV